MNSSNQLLQKVYTANHPVLDPSIPLEKYYSINLSANNKELKKINISDPQHCQEFIISQTPVGCIVGFGGYLEKRNLYKESQRFNPEGKPPRNIHLGIDFWAEEGITVHSPADGVVHSFADNQKPGDYGPTIILEHSSQDTLIYSLFGHLSRSSLVGISKGMAFKAGERIGIIGKTNENGGYAPHLHYQLIRDLENLQGDYPGVCDAVALEFYKRNCPDPALFLPPFP